MSPARGKILVIRGGAIGDFILTLPVFAALRRQFPETHLEVLGYPHIAGLARAGGLVDEVRSIESRALAGFFARGGRLDERLEAYFAGFAVIVSFLYDPDGIFQENVARCSEAQFIAGRHRPDEKSDRHATEVFLKPLERLAIFNADPVPRLMVGEASRPFHASGDSASQENRRDTGPALALHPGSGSKSKNWPEENWRELIARLRVETAFRFLLVGGEAEHDRLQRLSMLLPATRRLLVQSRPLVELAQWLKPCAGFIGHDSGISHLAAALELPALVLWGETRQAVWRPRGEKTRIIAATAGLAGITVGDVVAEARRRF
ncbi:MAG TPA: glycosyltransferase family 9 protein [Haliangiales bacterium]|nr:glycosyltransferase family 9 protein [Haliangiales bacterium]